MRMKKTFFEVLPKSKTLKIFKIVGRTTCNLNIYSCYILILSLQRLFYVAKAVSSAGFSKQTSLKSSTSVTHFLPKTIRLCCCI